MAADVVVEFMKHFENLAAGLISLAAVLVPGIS